MDCDFIKTEFVHSVGGKPLCVCSRPGCRRFGFSTEAGKLKAQCQSPVMGVGDVVYAAIKLATLGSLKTCDACLRRRLKLNRWLNWGVPGWAVKLLKRDRPLPWNDPLYRDKLRITKAGS